MRAGGAGSRAAEQTAEAPHAGLDFALTSTVESSTPGLSLQLGGYHDKLPVLLDAILARLARFSVREDRFAVVVEKFEQFFKNWDKQQPYSWCTRMADELLQTGAHVCQGHPELFQPRIEHAH